MKQSQLLLGVFVSVFTTVLAIPSPILPSDSGHASTGLHALRGFNYQIPGAGLSLRGSYNDSDSAQLRPDLFLIALRATHLAVTRHIATYGDRPLIPPENPIAQPIVGSTYELIIQSCGGALFYSDVRDVLDEEYGIGFLLRWTIRYHDFQAEILRDGRRLGYIHTVDFSSRASRFGRSHGKPAVDAPALPC
ncbi:MAG: hypothetical protein LQ338_004310 [Usnochroma carphineum]|nr:MAG: hypothetical protein LQ338_004310 [Usnochroma carphineum]